jgi:fumarate reductase flavoprotein subunit
MNTDVAILGAGAAGMFVALAAQARGLQVSLIDPHVHKANNFAISGGLFPAAGSALQRAAGITDSPQDWLHDLRQFAPGMVNEHIASAVAHALPLATEFLCQQCAAPLHFLPDMVAPGHGQLRFHSVVPASGAALHAWFRQACAQHPRIRWFSEPAQVQRLSQGFELQVGSEQLQARQIVLAGGGFGANPDMVARFIPGMAGALHNGSPTQDGSTLALGIAWGAQLWGMDGYQGQGHTHPGGATRLGMSIPTLGGFMANRAGLRFVAEDIGPSALAPAVLAQAGGVALEVFDAAIEAQLGNHGAYQQAVKAGRVITAPDVHSLAAQADVPLPSLQQTLQEVTAFALGQARDPLGRQGFARALVPPYKASWVTGALSHTQGGLLTCADGKVLDLQGHALPNVFAVGGCAAGLSGRGAQGYLPGNGLAQAFGLGWRLAQALT